MAIGAKIELWSNGKFQYTEHYLTRGYASSVDPIVHFGIGKETVIDSVRITWPASAIPRLLRILKLIRQLK